MDEVDERIRPYLEREGVVGIYLVGSATRPFADALSDHDFEIVVTDEAYAALPHAEKHVFVMDEGPPRRVDHEFYVQSLSALERLVDSRQDVIRYGYQHAAVLHDPEKRIAPMIRRLGDLPGDVRDARMKVHWLEFLFGLGRAQRTMERDRTTGARLVLHGVVRAATKVLFVAAGSWPAPPHWTREELFLLGVPDTLLETLDAAVETPTVEAVRALQKPIESFLRGERLQFFEDGKALVRWAFLTDEGKAAFERWSGA